MIDFSFGGWNFAITYTMFGSSLPSVVCRRAHVVFTFLCLLTHYSVQHILCCFFVLFCFSSSCVPYVASSPGLSNYDCPIGIL